MILTLCRSQQILERFARVQPLFALGAGPSFFTWFIIQMRCNETDKFDCKLVVNQTSFILSSSKAASTRLEERWMDHPDGQLAFNETLLRVFVPHAVSSSCLESGSGDFLPCLSIRINDIHLTQNTYVSPGALNEDFAMIGCLQWKRGCSLLAMKWWMASYWQWKGGCSEIVAAPVLWMKAPLASS